MEFLHWNLPSPSCCPTSPPWASPAPSHLPAAPPAAHLSQRRCWPQCSGQVQVLLGRKPHTGRCRSHWSWGQWALGSLWQQAAQGRFGSLAVSWTCIPACHSWTTGRSPSPGAPHPHGMTASGPGPAVYSHFLWSRLGWSGTWHSSWLQVDGEGRVAGAGPKPGSMSLPYPHPAPPLKVALLQVGSYTTTATTRNHHFAWKLLCLFICVFKSSKKLVVEKWV